MLDLLPPFCLGAMLLVFLFDLSVPKRVYDAPKSLSYRFHMVVSPAWPLLVVFLLIIGLNAAKKLLELTEPNIKAGDSDPLLAVLVQQ